MNFPSAFIDRIKLQFPEVHIDFLDDNSFLFNAGVCKLDSYLGAFGGYRIKFQLN